MNTRVIIIILASTFVITTTILLVQFAKGYRPDLNNGQIKSTGLLVTASEPKGAQVFLDDQLETATDNTLDLEPNNYLVEIKKEGYIPWAKQLKVEKGLVTQTDALLFPITPNLQAVTNSGALSPSLSPNGTKLLYVVHEATSSTQLETRNLKLETISGLWLLELTNLPLGFNQDPKQLIVGDPPQTKTLAQNWSQSQFIWSPDSREILALFHEPLDEQSTKLKNTENNQITNYQLPITLAYLINTSATAQPNNQLTNIANKYQSILLEWQEESNKQIQNQIKKLPPEFADLIATTSANPRFSPDETKLLYTATASAQLANQYPPQILAASTQIQHRQLEQGQTYLYDLKEDRNFLILNQTQTNQISSCQRATSIGLIDEISALQNQLQKTDNRIPTTDHLICPKLNWFPTSRHLIYFSDGKISIMEYDSTNNQVIYAGPIEQNYVFAHPSPSKLLLVTNLNPDAFPYPNIYTLSLR